MAPERFGELADQVVAQTNCRSGVVLAVRLAHARVDASLCPYPLLLRGAAASLYAVVDSAPVALTTLRITRALTTFVSQYAAFRRGFLRICGETEAAPYVGTTLHEKGASVTVLDADSWAPLFVATGVWRRSAADTFTYQGPDTLDLGRRTVDTFQRMWNDAYPWDPISAPTPGVFDTATQARLERALVAGIREARLCATVGESNSFDSAAIALVILVPMLTAACGLALYLWLMGSLFGSRTPFDTGSAKEAALPDGLGAPTPAGLSLGNSVEDTSALSEYAESTLDRSGDDTAAAEEEEEEDSGIW